MAALFWADDRIRLDQAFESVLQALTVARDHDSRVLEAHWSVEFGKVAHEAGRPGEALVSYQRAAVLQRQLGDRSREAQALLATGDAYRGLGRADVAVNFHRHVVATFRELDDRWRLALSLAGLAADLDHTPAASDAAQHRREALTLVADFDDPRAVQLHRQLTVQLEPG